MMESSLCHKRVTLNFAKSSAWRGGREGLTPHRSSVWEEVGNGREDVTCGQKCMQVTILVLESSCECVRMYVGVKTGRN